MFFKKKIYPFFSNGVFKNNRNSISRFHIYNSIKIYLKVLWNNFFKKSDFSRQIHIQNNTSLDGLSTKISTIYSNEPLIIPMGHATNLIYFNQFGIITDPLFGSPSFLLNRYIPIIPNPELLPTINAILISHNHPDHLDIKSLKFLLSKNPELAIHAPLGNKKLLKKIGFVEIHEYTWWQSKEIVYDRASIKFTFLPAFHWTQRSLFDQNKTLWGSFMIELDNYKIYFAGDSAYSDHFKQIGSHYNDIDCGLIPIAPLEPLENIEETHMSIQESVQACVDLNLKSIIPIHWGIFKFGIEYLADPIKLFKEELDKKNILFRLKTDKIGEFCFLDKNLKKEESTEVLISKKNSLFKEEKEKIF